MKSTSVLKTYLIFKHVWTEFDTGVREYDYLRACATADEAIQFVSEYYRSNKDNPFLNWNGSGTLDIDVLFLARKSSEESKWKYQQSRNEYICTANNCFKVVNGDQIVNELCDYNNLEYVSEDNLGERYIPTPFPQK